MLSAPRLKAKNIVFSRPIYQPQSGRAMPLVTRSKVSAKVNAGRVRPSMLTGTPATPKLRAMPAKLAVKVSPAAVTSSDITKSNQKSGDRSTSPGV